MKLFKRREKVYPRETLFEYYDRLPLNGGRKLDQETSFFVSKNVIDPPLSPPEGTVAVKLTRGRDTWWRSVKVFPRCDRRPA